MSRIRIVCKVPPLPVEPAFRIAIPSFADCCPVFIDDAGVEHPILGVASVRWYVSRERGPVAFLEVEGAEIDAVAEVLGVSPTSGPVEGVR